MFSVFLIIMQGFVNIIGVLVYFLLTIGAYQDSGAWTFVVTMGLPITILGISMFFRFKQKRELLKIGC